MVLQEIKLPSSVVWVVWIGSEVANWYSQLQISALGVHQSNFVSPRKAPRSMKTY